jgi:hypothetical protein
VIYGEGGDSMKIIRWKAQEGETVMTTEFYHNGICEVSEGPYGYLFLGLVYEWREEDKCLQIKNAILIQVDRKLGYSMGMALYEDMFERPFAEIYEENGIHYYKGTPILNYKMLNIPEILSGIEEEEQHFGHGVIRRFYSKGPLKYSINPICTGYGEFDKVYKELYACVLSFDAETMTGSAVGFDALGKICECRYKHPVEELYEKMIDDFPLRFHKPGEEAYARGLEFNFLNLSCETDENGNKTYHYSAIL